MNKIIKFPKKNKRKNIDDVLVDRLTDDHNHVDLGRVPFTCGECNQTVIFEFTNAIFRHVSFYCAKCGHGYKITNPMFSPAFTLIQGKRSKSK